MRESNNVTTTKSTMAASKTSGAAGPNGRQNQGNANDNNATMNSLETKLDALIAYTQSLEHSNRALTEQSSLWQTRYQAAMSQQSETRQRLEHLLDHLKTLEKPKSP